jgi:hypothetical protein
MDSWSSHFIGFAAKISTLDSIAGRIPTDGPLIVVTASFEGIKLNYICVNKLTVCQANLLITLVISFSVSEIFQSKTIFPMFIMQFLGAATMIGSTRIRRFRYFATISLRRMALPASSRGEKRMLAGQTSSKSSTSGTQNCGLF